MGITSKEEMIYNDGKLGELLERYLRVGARGWVLAFGRCVSFLSPATGEKAGCVERDAEIASSLAVKLEAGSSPAGRWGRMG